MRPPLPDEGERAGENEREGNSHDLKAEKGADPRQICHVGVREIRRENRLQGHLTPRERTPDLIIKTNTKSGIPPHPIPVFSFFSFLSLPLPLP